MRRLNGRPNHTSNLLCVAQCWRHEPTPSTEPPATVTIQPELLCTAPTTTCTKSPLLYAELRTHPIATPFAPLTSSPPAGQGAHIFDSLLGAPPVTLATRRPPSSVLSSFSWVCRSFLLLSRSSCAFSLATRGTCTGSHQCHQYRHSLKKLHVLTRGNKEETVLVHSMFAMSAQPGRVPGWRAQNDSTVTLKAKTLHCAIHAHITGASQPRQPKTFFMLCLHHSLRGTHPSSCCQPHAKGEVHLQTREGRGGC